MSDTPQRRARRALPDDVAYLSWAAEQLGIANSTAYRLAEAGEMPGAFKVGGSWRISKPRFLREIHGAASEEDSRAGEHDA